MGLAAARVLAHKETGTAMGQTQRERQRERERGATGDSLGDGGLLVSASNSFNMPSKVSLCL